MFTPLGAFSVLCEALLARNMLVKRVALRPLLSFTISRSSWQSLWLGTGSGTGR